MAHISIDFPVKDNIRVSKKEDGGFLVSFYDERENWITMHGTSKELGKLAAGIYQGLLAIDYPSKVAVEEAVEDLVTMAISDGAYKVEPPSRG